MSGTILRICTQGRSWLKPAALAVRARLLSKSLLILKTSMHFVVTSFNDSSSSTPSIDWPIIVGV
jgi:hypothetical protein